MKLALILPAFAAVILVPILLLAADPPKEGETAPRLALKTHEGKPFDLAERKGKGWTVVYFYPKADTPGCTKQACAFRDSIKAIRELGAEVYGVSVDKVEAQAKFHEKHSLSFTLLADAEGEAARDWGVKLPGIPIAKRWTFLVDADLRIRKVFKDVDPVADAKEVADELKTQRATPAKG